MPTRYRGLVPRTEASEGCWVSPWHPLCHGTAGLGDTELCPAGERTVLCQIQEREMLGDSLGLIKFSFIFGLKAVSGWAGHAGDLLRD